MTSPSKHLPYNAPRWDYSIQRYKSHHPFCEPGLTSILFLAHGRPELTRRTMLATLDCVKQMKNFEDKIEVICIENGDCRENYEFFQNLDIPRKVVVRQNNYGINQGLNQAWALSRGEFCMVHENDWEPHKIVDFFSIVQDIFNEKQDVGIVQLRSIWDQNEQWGRGKPDYWPWDLSPEVLAAKSVKVWREKTKAGHEFLISNFENGFNNNPIVMHKNLYREVGPYPEPEVGTDPRHGETQYQHAVAASGCRIAHINIDLYYHIGRIQTVPK